MKKQRLDTLLVARGLAANLANAQAKIGAGQVLVDDQPAGKAGWSYSEECQIRLRERCPYVSRGGLKLAKALQHFAISPQLRICLDVGASSGGFTDCLLQHGAAQVYAVDVAYGQLDWKLRQDSRVVVIERTNVRHLPPGLIDTAIHLAVMDVSFISITKVIPAICPLFSGPVSIIALIKPQFELPAAKVGTGGVVREAALHLDAIAKIRDFAVSLGLACSEPVTSPILGPKGNSEFLVHLSGSSPPVD